MQFLWDTREPAIAGLKQLNTEFHAYVNQAYHSVLSIQIVALVFTVVLFSTYLLFVLRPFLKEMRGETRRIAELLSQVRVYLIMIVCSGL